ncbi:glycosyl hydrolase family 65 central catalytic domain-containing protein [Geopyxis carbonaria]|nr:glycosyl hydrolase family 65 central catalytic domain-containing protein [Geopyxis carbonaria]
MRLTIFVAASLATLALGFPWTEPHLETRQIGTPRPNDHENFHRIANMTEYDPETWTLGTHKFVQNAYQVQPYVANGYHGSRLTAEGAGYWRIHNLTGDTWPINGWPLDNPRQTVATISGFWDAQHNTTRTNFPELLENGWESVISGIPTWSSFVIATADGKHAYAPGVDKKQVEAYHQTLSIRDGIVTTTVTWRPVENGPAYTLDFTILAHRSRMNLGMMKIEVTASDDSELIFTDVLDGQGAQRTDAREKSFETDSELNAIWTSVNPIGVKDVTAFEYSTLDLPFSKKEGILVTDSRKDAKERPWVSRNDSTISQEFLVKAKKGETLTVLKYVGIASTDAFPDPEKTAKNAALEARKIGWKKLVAEHRECWGNFWEDGDIVIPGAEQVEMQITARASIFHLLSNVRSAEEGPGIGDNSISVGGLSSDSYGGLVFWDADLWMLPSLLVLFPDHAAAINEYRSRMLPQARENAKRYELPGALYPWTSARYGNCTGTGPCVDYQYHLNTDIALVHWHQFLTTGDSSWLKEKGWPIIQAVAEMWTGKVQKANRDDEDGLLKGMYTVNNMTDPDEYANHINNGAFTNAGVKVIMGVAQHAARLVGYSAPKEWADIEKNMFIPFNTDAGIIPEYAGMNGSVQIKQADVVLINYPLEFRLNETQASNDLDFYARAQSPDGPAMTWAMFAVNAADLSPHGCASWTYTLYASQPYLREPFAQFSEQIIDNIYINGNTKPAFIFLTGHGGSLQIMTHGYTGYRPRLDAFYLDPSLPPQLSEGIQINGMKHQGAIFDVHITLDTVTVIRREDKKRGHRSPVTVRFASRNEKAGDYVLYPGQKIVVPTRRPDLNGTDIPGNKAECKPAFSSSEYTPGQFPVGAVDGSNHTNWRPHSAEPAELFVDLGKTQNINGMAMNWAKWPPRKFSVYATNDSIPGENWTKVYHDDDVKISEPWKPSEALKVIMHKGNQTNVDLDDDQKASGRWVKLVIEGDRSGTGAGGTVAQFAIL